VEYAEAETSAEVYNSTKICSWLAGEKED